MQCDQEVISGDEANSCEDSSCVIRIRARAILRSHSGDIKM